MKMLLAAELSQSNQTACFSPITRNRARELKFSARPQPKFKLKTNAQEWRIWKKIPLPHKNNLWAGFLKIGGFAGREKFTKSRQGNQELF